MADLLRMPANSRGRPDDIHCVGGAEGRSSAGRILTAASDCRALAGHPARLYGSYMSEMTVSEARDRLADAIDRARTSHEPVVLTRRGRRVAVLVDADDFARMSDLVEDALDRAELEAARSEDDYVPWEQVKADLGLA